MWSSVDWLQARSFVELTAVAFFAIEAKSEIVTSCAQCVKWTLHQDLQAFYLLHRGIALKGFERLKTLQAFITWSQPHKKSFTKNFRLSMKRTCWNLCRHRSNLLLVPWPPWPPWPLRLHFSSSGIDGILAFFFNYVARSSELALSACFSHKGLGAWVSVSKRMSRMVVFDDAHAMIGSD